MPITSLTMHFILLYNTMLNIVLQGGAWRDPKLIQNITHSFQVPLLFLQLLSLCLSVCFLGFLFLLLPETTTKELLSPFGNFIFLTLKGKCMVKS